MLVLTAWTAHAGQLSASINGTGANGGGSIFQYNPFGKQSIALSGLDRPRGLVFDKIGNLFVATTTLDSSSGNQQGTIFKITPKGKISTFATGFGANVALEGLVTDSGGNFFVVAINFDDPNLASTIFLITPGGTVSMFGSTPGETFGLAFDSAGNLFAADIVDLTIFKFTRAGVRSVFAAGPPNFTATQAPAGLAFDKSGNLFVSTEGNEPMDAILKFTPAGVVTTFAMGLQNPRGLAFSANGDLFVAELGSFTLATAGDILEFTPQGARTVLASGLGPATGNGGAEFLAFR